MSVREVGYRLYKELLVRLERGGIDGMKRVPDATLVERPPWIYPDLEIDESTLLCEAERSLENCSPIFALSDGISGAEWEWNRDPLTGIRAPLTFGKGLDYRDQSLVGNIKYLWEPNRQLELVTLARAYRVFGEERYLRDISCRLSSWLDQCPYPLGPNWSSSLELGIRLINWSIVWDLLGGKDAPLFAGEDGERLRDRWLTSIYQHVHFIDGYYSKFSSANNHIIGEASGVYVATVVWPFWPKFEKFSRQARSILLRESKKQTHADGVNREQAIAYQQFVIDFLLCSANRRIR